MALGWTIDQIVEHRLNIVVENPDVDDIGNIFEKDINGNYVFTKEIKDNLKPDMYNLYTKHINILNPLVHDEKFYAKEDLF
jgi:hypothetical protein